MNKDHINKLVQADRDKVGKFLSIAESGAAKSGLTPEQQQRQREYVQRQADAYANAAFRASHKDLSPTDPGYLDAVREMNGVRNNLENLATQQKAIEKNQKQFLDDFSEGRISKANYSDGTTMPLADIYSGISNMEIDEYGNLMFEDGAGEFKPYTQLADYSLKSYDVANSLLSDIEKIADSKKGLSSAQMGLFKNKITATINEAGRSDILSILNDDLLPGLGDLDIPEELMRPENIGKLKNFVIDTVGNAGDDINNSFFNTGKEKGKGKDTDEYVMGSNTGLPLDMRQSYMNQITNLNSGESITIEGISFSGDPRPAKRKGSRGKMTYQFRPDPSGGGYVFGAIDSSTGKLVRSGVISEDQLRLEMLGEGPGDPLENATVVPPNDPGILARPTDVPEEKDVEVWTPNT